LAINWHVEVLNDIVRAEIRNLPSDMRARFVRFGDLVSQVGLENLREPQVKHIEGKLWEIRLTGRDRSRSLCDSGWEADRSGPRLI
jgi:phage-related protein